MPRTNPKAAFFDMDGTIVAPVFHTNRGVAPGFLGPDWQNYNNTRRATAYAGCKLVTPIIDYARKLKQSGCDVKILTVVLSEGEIEAKSTFVINNRLNNLFSDIVFVHKSQEKIPFMQKYAKEHNLQPQDLMIVEDNYIIPIIAHNEGMQGMHISHIITGVNPNGEG